jgi:hypothetical protein
MMVIKDFVIMLLSTTKLLFEIISFVNIELIDCEVIFGVEDQVTGILNNVFMIIQDY